MLDLGDKVVNAFGVWEAIVKINKLTQEQLLYFGNKLNNLDVWEVIYEALKD